MNKTVKNLAFLFIATLLVGFSFTSCSDDDDDSPIAPPAWTQGTWEDEYGYGYKLVVTSDNIIEYYYYDDEEVVDDFLKFYKLIGKGFNFKEEKLSESYTVYSQMKGDDEWDKSFSFVKTDNPDQIYYDGGLYNRVKK